VIFINGAIEQIPDTLLGQLGEGGRLVTAMREAGHARAFLFLKEHGSVGRRPDFDAEVPLLAGFKKAIGFVF
jgi:protein-L-isoaspartate(D-aspartate) O-methyltransferase